MFIDARNILLRQVRAICFYIILNCHNMLQYLKTTCKWEGSNLYFPKSARDKIANFIVFIKPSWTGSAEATDALPSLSFLQYSPKIAWVHKSFDFDFKGWFHETVRRWTFKFIDLKFVGQNIPTRNKSKTEWSAFLVCLVHLDPPLP